MKDIVSGNGDFEKECEKETENKTGSDSKTTTKQDERNPLDTFVEKDSKNETQDEDNEQE